MAKLTRRAMIYSSALILSLSLGTGGVLSQPKVAEEKDPDIRLGEITFQVREFQSSPSPLKMLEIHIEISNKSRQTTAPPNSIRLVMVPTGSKYPEGSSAAEFNPTREETMLTVPLLPNTTRILTLGFSLPENIPESMTFEIQVNPPEGEKKMVTWEGVGIK